MLPCRALSLALLLSAHLGESASPIQPQLLAAETYAETFSTIADLDDGTYVQAQLAVSNLGPGDARGICRALLARVNTAPWAASETVSREGWAFHAAPQPTLQVGPCRIRDGDHTMQWDITLGERTILLTLQQKANPVVPPLHPIRVDDDATYASHILVAWADVSATLVGADGRVEEHRGRGYADHARSTTLPGDVARGWVRFRGLKKGCARLLLGRRLPAAEPSWQMYAMRERGQPTQAWRQVRVQVEGGERQVRVGIDTGDCHLRIDGFGFLYRHAPLEELGFLGRIVGHVVGNVVTTTYRAILHEEPPSQPGRSHAGPNRGKDDNPDGGQRIPHAPAAAAPCTPLKGILEVTDVGG